MTPEDQPKLEEAVLGAMVYYWPESRVEQHAKPFVGVITTVYSAGIADISIIPDMDGTVLLMDQAFNMGDKRLFDSRGNVSTAGNRRGCWEYTPFSKACLENAKPSRKPAKATS